MTLSKIGYADSFGITTQGEEDLHFVVIEADENLILGVSSSGCLSGISSNPNSDR